VPAEIFFKASAEREFRRLPREIQRRFARVFELLVEDPTRARPGLDVKRLRGVKGAWRLRVGDYRGIYEVEPGKVRFTRFGHRSNIYEI
jgi:addiction module RelE/StbE family toxin